MFRQMYNHVPIQRWPNSGAAMLRIDGFSKIAQMHGCVVTVTEKEGTQDEQQNHIHI